MNTTGSFTGSIAIGLAWAAIWAVPGVAIEIVDNIAPAAHGFTRLVDMWAQTLALPGLVAGLLFAAIVSVAEGRRRIADLLPSRAGAWGAASGLALGVLVVWVLDVGLSEPTWLAVALTGIATLLGFLSGTGTPVLFRMASTRRGSSSSSPEPTP